MDGLDILGVVGELFGWVGLLCAVPLLTIALVIRAVEGPAVRTEIVVVDDEDGHPLARWFAAGEVHQRRLRHAEHDALAAEESPSGFIASHLPGRMRLGRRHPITRLCLTLGTIALVAGLLGVVVSFAPLLLGDLAAG